MNRLARLVLHIYPRSIRRDHGPELATAIESAWRDRATSLGRARLLAELAADALASWPRQWRATRRAGDSQPAGPHAGGWLPDLRNAVRLFTRTPLLSVGAVFTLALGIGATSAIFSLADATLLRPLPIRAPADVWQIDFSWSHPDFRDLEGATTPFVEFGAWSNQTFGLDRAGEPIEISGAVVSGGYFALTGLRPMAGRLLQPSDDVAGASPTAVVSDGAWTRLFGRNPALIGAVLQVNRRPVTVVGVAPRAFRGLTLSEAPDLFLPIHSMTAVGTGLLSRPAALANRGLVWLNVVGRLRPTATPAQGVAALEALYRRLHPLAPGESPDPVTMQPLVRTAVGFGRGDDVRRFVTVLLGATVVTLLLACATVANLLLVRADRRRREMALRTALGASRARLVRLVALESVAIGLAGGLGGLGVATLALRLLETFDLPGQVAIADLGLTLSPTLLGYAVALGLLTSLIFGLAPAWHASRSDPHEALQEGARGTSRQPVRRGLVAAQVGLCVLLLLGSFAFGRAMHYALSLDLGFDTTHAVLVSVDPGRARYSRDQVADVEARVTHALTAERWVIASGWMAVLPLHGSMSWTVLPLGPNAGVKKPLDVLANVVSDGYFAAMGIPLRAGRTFRTTDSATTPLVMVVSESMARRYWPLGTALGARISTDPDSHDPATLATVIGVVGDVRHGVDRPPDPMFYVTSRQHADMLDFSQYLVVRTSQAPDRAAAAILATLHAVDRGLLVSRTQTMSEHLGTLLMPQRLGLTLLVLFTALALVLTILGIYAVVAAAVSQRIREIGIRLALGAERASVLGLVARQGLPPVGAGVVGGVAVFALVSNALAALIFALPPLTFMTALVFAGSVGLVALAALIVPARRAVGIDPAVALRQN